MTTGKEYFTPREAKVWKLAMKGKTEAQIAARLRISKKTVSTHKRNISLKRRKLNLPPLKDVAQKPKSLEIR